MKGEFSGNYQGDIGRALIRGVVLIAAVQAMEWSIAPPAAAAAIPPLVPISAPYKQGGNVECQPNSTKMFGSVDMICECYDAQYNNCAYVPNPLYGSQGTLQPEKALKSTPATTLKSKSATPKAPAPASTQQSFVVPPTSEPPPQYNYAPPTKPIFEILEKIDPKICWGVLGLGAVVFLAWVVGKDIHRLS